MSGNDAFNKAIALLNAQADNPACVWSVATFGAIAEYHGTADTPVNVLRDNNTLTLTSDQGSARMQFHPNMQLVAYEGLSKMPNLWSQGISLCLPVDQAQMGGNTTITELESDERGMSLFDLGVGAPHMDACVRTDNENLIKLFHKFDGLSLFDECHELVAAIVECSPTRVFSSALACIEVHTPIPKSDSETPHGAHTHVLPDLLAHGRTHAATVPIPEGWLPCLNLFPANPARNHSGNEKDFHEPTHNEFQAIMAEFADPDVVAMKDSVRNAVLSGQSPEIMNQPQTRRLRTALRVALRQIQFTHGKSDNLDAWIAGFDTNNELVDE